MKTLLVYATKYGATKTISEMLAAKLGGATLHDLSGGEPSFAGYDCIVLGSPITAGTVRKEMKAFAEKHQAELQHKRLGIFVSGLQEEGEAEYLAQNFPAALLQAAKAKAFLGGIFDPQKCGFIARKMIKAIAKLDSYTSTIDEEKIALFARQLAS